MIKSESITVPIPSEILVDFEHRTGKLLPEELKLGIEYEEDGNGGVFIYSINNNLIIKNNVIMLDNGYVTEESLDIYGEEI